jgi:hypothetical protein
MYCRCKRVIFLRCYIRLFAKYCNVIIKIHSFSVYSSVLRMISFQQSVQKSHFLRCYIQKASRRWGPRNRFSRTGYLEPIGPSTLKLSSPLFWKKKTFSRAPPLPGELDCDVEKVYQTPRVCNQITL